MSRDARARLIVIALLLFVAIAPGIAAQPSADEAKREAALRLDAGRFTVVAYPRDERLARSILARATARDSFPGLPRPREHVLIAIAPDQRRFRAWIGPAVPEWGSAVAFPESHRIVLQGSAAASDAGDPAVALRHELAHMALAEYLGPLPSRWFHEGYASYAAGEWGREEALATNVALALSGMPSLDSLEAGFEGGSRSAEQSYALAFRAVTELASLDDRRGLALFFRYWKETGSFERAIRDAYGVTSVAFERLWQSRTRRRYGALALFANLSLVATIGLLALGPLFVARRRRDRQRLAAMRLSEAAAERAARESALEALLAGGIIPLASDPALPNESDESSATNAHDPTHPRADG